MNDLADQVYDEYPDKWVIVKVADGLYKILAGWIGGYLGADEWRISSGIESIKIIGNDYYIKNQSGSIYRCNKNYEGFSSLTSSTFNRFKSEHGDQISVIPIADLPRFKFEDSALIKEMIKNPDKYLYHKI